MKRGERKVLYPSKSPGSCSPDEKEACSSRGEYNNNGHWPVCASVNKSCNQLSEYRSLVYGGEGPFCPSSFQKAVCKLLQEPLHSCLPALGMGNG